MPVTYSFSSGGTITAAELNTNFTDILNELSGITAADLHANAGIVSTQLTDRYAIVTETVNLTGYIHRENSAGTNAVYYLPNVTASPGTEVWRKYMTLRSSRAYYLCGISVFAQDITAGGGGEKPALWVTRNGTVLGGSNAQVDADATVYHLRNSNPIDNPLTSLANNDYITIGIGVSAASAAVIWRGVSVTFTYKMELSA